MTDYRCNLGHLSGKSLSLAGKLYSIDAEGVCAGVEEAHQGWFEAQPKVWQRLFAPSQVRVQVGDVAAPFVAAQGMQVEEGMQIQELQPAGFAEPAIGRRVRAK